MRRLIWLCLLIAAACTAAPSTTVGDPADGAITLAQAEQADAPAVAASAGGVAAVWVGSDDRGVHQDARRITGTQLGEIVTLPLPPTHPYDQRLIAGVDGRLHLLWLDADQDGQTNLYAALITPTLQVERGPISVSEGLALRYTVVADGSGGLWVAWSGGAISETNVYLRHVDSDGRPLQTALVAENANNPALLRTDAGDLWLFWLAGGQVMAQQIDPPDTPRALTSAISVAPADRLINTGAALDLTNAYYYWNVTRASGVSETWITAGSLSANLWQSPQRLRVDAKPAVLSWFAPLSGQRETLTAVGQGVDGLSLLSLRAGLVKDDKVLLPDVTLIGMPALLADETGALYLSWSAFGESVADLKIIQIAP